MKPRQLKQFAIIATEEDLDSIAQMLIKWKKQNNKMIIPAGADGGWLGFLYYEILGREEYEQRLKEKHKASD